MKILKPKKILKVMFITDATEEQITANLAFLDFLADVFIRDLYIEEVGDDGDKNTGDKAE